MDPGSSDNGDSGTVAEPNFGFAFNDSNFSDRKLRIEIVDDSPDCKKNGDDVGATSISDWATNRKRRRENENDTASTDSNGDPVGSVPSRPKRNMAKPQHLQDYIAL